MEEALTSLFFGVPTIVKKELPWIYYGSPAWLWQKAEVEWLPKDIQKNFWLAWFSKTEWIRKDAENQLKRLGVEEVKGSVYLPDEHLISLEKQGRYSKIYKYKDIYFVPVYYEYDGNRYIKFRALTLEAKHPFLG